MWKSAEVSCEGVGALADAWASVVGNRTSHQTTVLEMGIYLGYLEGASPAAV